MFWNAMVTTFIYVIICIPLLTILPLLLALLVEKKIPGISFFRTVAYFPRHRIGRRSRPHLELDVRFSRPY